MQRLVAGEGAAVLGRLGRAVEASLARLRAASDGERETLEYACAETVWRYFVQREACGLRGHDRVIEEYGIPPRVLAKVGASPPP